MQNVNRGPFEIDDDNWTDWKYRIFSQNRAVALFDNYDDVLLYTHSAEWLNQFLTETALLKDQLNYANRTISSIRGNVLEQYRVLGNGYAKVSARIDEIKAKTLEVLEAKVAEITYLKERLAGEESYNENAVDELHQQQDDLKNLIAQKDAELVKLTKENTMLCIERDAFKTSAAQKDSEIERLSSLLDFAKSEAGRWNNAAIKANTNLAIAAGALVQAKDTLKWGDVGNANARAEEIISTAINRICQETK
ncbi:hypothetical protein LJK88_20370 [Paenibacillus sp. P26]|nr:hypothetical protein LJK88_20370 [Paenibacillus sp. P26]